jgi:hypothetical protein
VLGWSNRKFYFKHFCAAYLQFLKNIRDQFVILGKKIVVDLPFSKNYRVYLKFLKYMGGKNFKFLVFRCYLKFLKFSLDNTPQIPLILKILQINYKNKRI